MKHNFTIIHDEDETGRNIGYSQLSNVRIIGRNNFYPNCLFYSENDEKIISPYDEKIMSLNKDSFYDENEIEKINKINKINEIEKIKYTQVIYPVFFFIYNFDNYYHFLYDTLPYLYTYLELKKN